MQNVPSVAVPLYPLASYIYVQHETSRICMQPRPSFPNHRSIILILKCFFFMKEKCLFLFMDGVQLPLKAIE